MSSRRTGGTAVVAALGVVFGDIGTSPLYALRTMLGDAGHLDRTAVLGVTSLAIWSLVLVVTVLYVGTLLRVDNDGEGGLLALLALLRRTRRRTVAISVIGMVGAAMFLGDSVVTPSISVLSAAEGLNVASSAMKPWVVPIALALLVGVFALQRAGSGTIGKVYGPVMCVWFGILTATGIGSLVRTPDGLQALSPLWAARFVADRPLTGFLCLGAVVLAVTGAEALYADLGHFGRAAITRCWLLIVFPALVIAYAGEAGAVLREGSKAASEPFYAVVPGWATIPVLVVATLATVIASEAVIAGAFTVLHQAAGLNLFPSLRTLHTSREEAARIYIPVANWTLAAAVLGVVLAFRSSDALSSAYGVAVTATFLTTVSLLALLGRHRVIAIVAWIVVLVFFAATLPKIVSGGAVPVAIGVVLFVVMWTWWSGQRRLHRARAEEETSPEEVAREITEHCEETRSVGTAVFLTQDHRVGPLALRSLVRSGWQPAEHVVLLSWHVHDRPGADPDESSVTVDSYAEELPGLVGVEVTLGYRERLDVSTVIDDAREEHADVVPELDEDDTWYFVSESIPRRSKRRGPAGWLEQLFILLVTLSTDRIDQLQLPRDRTLLVGRELRL